MFNIPHLSEWDINEGTKIQAFFRLNNLFITFGRKSARFFRFCATFVG